MILFNTKDVGQTIHLMPCRVLTLRASRPENLATGLTTFLPLADEPRTYPSFSAFQYEMLCMHRKTILLHVDTNAKRSEYLQHPALQNHDG